MNEFLNYLEIVKKRSKQTIKQYRSILREFQKFEPITQKSWKRYLQLISKNKPKTQANKLKIVKEYLNWKVDHGLLKTDERFWNEAEPPKENTLPKALDLEEIQKLIDNCDNPYYRAIFKLLVNTGMRLSELVNLSLDDISFNGVARLKIRGKGNKERILAVKRELIEEAIQAGVFERKVSQRAIQSAIKRYAQKAGIKHKITPHMLRHSFAVALIEKGVPINKIQALLGHASIATTGIYLKIATSNIEVPQLI
jgi:integrase/recombinase XerD